MTDSTIDLTASLCALGRAIGAGTLDPIDLTTAYLAAAEAHTDSARIYARLTPERALAEASAAAAGARSGTRRGVLDGVPISWKDLFDTAGVATEAGSVLLKDRVPSRDARVLTRASAAGLVCLGKTHMSELAFSGLGLNPMAETPPNIHDPALVPGGSSSGAAASVAHGLAPAAVGSDTGGSVRIPAAWNDLVGLKTTAGQLPLEGVVPLAAAFDTVGPICRTVEDAAALYAVLRGCQMPDLTGATLAGARLLILDNVVFDDIADAPQTGFDTAVQGLADAGAQIDRRAIPAVSEAMDLSAVLYTVDAYAQWRETIEAAPHLMYDRILDRFRAGAEFSGIDYVAAWKKLTALRAQYLSEVAGYDAVILPTAPNTPPDAARLMSDDAYYVTQNLRALRNTRVGNLMGLCALTLPTGTPACGISFQTNPGDEMRLLRLGAAASAALA